jgi:hypothetical protein
MSAMIRLHAILAAAAALALAGPAQAATYKWVDDKGIVHYSDKVPPEALDKGNVELNKQGLQVKRNDPAPTAEQRRAKAAEEERQKTLAREQEVVDRRDRALVQSYASEDEIDLARSRALGTIESQLQSAQAYSVQLAKRRQELDETRKSYGTKPVPAAIDRELEGIATELSKQDAFIAEKKRETVAVTSRYDADKQRWRELRAVAEAKEAKEASMARDPKQSAGSGGARTAAGSAPGTNGGTTAASTPR